jgi:hypothetical protein
MYLSQCPLCDHVNPTGSRFCNACGAPLHLAPCPDCGTINEVAQHACRDCGRVLQAPAPARGDGRAAARVRRAPPRAARGASHLLAIAGGAALVVVAIYGLWLHADVGEREVASAVASPLSAPAHARAAAEPAAEPRPAPPPEIPADATPPVADPPWPVEAAPAHREAGRCAPAVAALGLCGNGRRRD